ncbi:hypothetical protein QBZ16_005030 [Prototheca wickerhamii]|uniref:U2A'/phosphoprotein 32 family A C-terminal domain-containing protein n=1 Tax=Prototheca wickerhamii TaxID=3111 RepID=A0AAD9IEG1_PROWI|nr:hypothetical protein QBZ16_005030 [Prototheca wickerhamii]
MLDATANRLKHIEDKGVGSLKKLRILDVSNNRLVTLDGLEDHPALTDLWANDNQLESLEEVETVLQQYSQTLSCVYLSGNPCAGVQQYRRRVTALLPHLEQLDDAVLSS